MRSEFEYYNASTTLEETIKWVAFVRCFCHIRNSACIYTRYRNDSTYHVFGKLNCIPVPETVSNVLCEAIVNTRRFSLFDESDSPIIVTDNYRALSDYTRSRSPLRINDHLVNALATMYKPRRSDVRKIIDRALCYAISIVSKFEGSAALTLPEVVFVSRHATYEGLLISVDGFDAYFDAPVISHSI